MNALSELRDLRYRGVLRPDLEPERIETARRLQRRGRTLTEIAIEMRVERQAVVDALYWNDQVVAR